MSHHPLLALFALLALIALSQAQLSLYTRHNDDDAFASPYGFNGLRVKYVPGNDKKRRKLGRKTTSIFRVDDDDMFRGLRVGVDKIGLKRRLFADDDAIAGKRIGFFDDDAIAGQRIDSESDEFMPVYVIDEQEKRRRARERQSEADDEFIRLGGESVVRPIWSGPVVRPFPRPGPIFAYDDDDEYTRINYNGGSFGGAPKPTWVDDDMIAGKRLEPRPRNTFTPNYERIRINDPSPQFPRPSRPIWVDDDLIAGQRASITRNRRYRTSSDDERIRVNDPSPWYPRPSKPIWVDDDEHGHNKHHNHGRPHSIVHIDDDQILRWKGWGHGTRVVDKRIRVDKPPMHRFRSTRGGDDDEYTRINYNGGSFGGAPKPIWVDDDMIAGKRLFAPGTIDGETDYSDDELLW